MSVYKPPGRQTYVYDFRRGGDRYRGNTGSPRRRAAEAAERAEIERVEACLKQGHAAAGPTLGQLAGWWWAHHGASDRDEATSWYRLEKLLAGIGEATMIAGIDDSLLAGWVATRRAAPTRRGRPPAPATVNREVELLRRILRKGAKPLRYAVPDIDWGQLRRAEPRERVVEMTAAEEAALFAALAPRHHPLFRHYLLTGVRLSMATGLLKAGLDLAAGWVAFQGKAAPGAAEASRHVLPVTPAMRELYLKALEGNTTAHVFTFRAQRTQAARPGRAGFIRGRHYPYTPSYVDTIWDRAKARAAAAAPSIARLRLHDLRHTAATRFYRDTTDLRATQRLLGHSDARSTQKYAHVFDADLAAKLCRHHAIEAPPAFALVRATREP
jgi:integrase